MKLFLPINPKVLSLKIYLGEKPEILDSLVQNLQKWMMKHLYINESILIIILFNLTEIYIFDFQNLNSLKGMKMLVLEIENQKY